MLKATYPALFYFTEEKSYTVFFPDFGYGATQGANLQEAIDMAADWLGINVADLMKKDMELPTASFINDFSPKSYNPFSEDPDFDFVFDEAKSFASMVTVDLKDYILEDKPVKKTLSIPKWADQLGQRLQLNFSQTLTEAIVAKSEEMRHT